MYARQLAVVAWASTTWLLSDGRCRWCWWRRRWAGDDVGTESWELGSENWELPFWNRLDAANNFEKVVIDRRRDQNNGGAGNITGDQVLGRAGACERLPCVRSPR